MRGLGSIALTLVGLVSAAAPAHGAPATSTATAPIIEGLAPPWAGPAAPLPILIAQAIPPRPSPEATPAAVSASVRPSPAAASERAMRTRGSIAHWWWFWAALGAAAVGVVIAGIALGPRDAYSGNASPGVLTAF
jgi:hypothetical protein